MLLSRIGIERIKVLGESASSALGLTLIYSGKTEVLGIKAAYEICSWKSCSNVNGKITDERFMQLPNKYDAEQAELKKQIVNIREQLARLDEMKTSKDI